MIGGGALGKLFDRGLASRFYTPLIVGLVLSVLLALVADALILLIQRGTPAVGAEAAAGMNLFAYLQDPANWFGPGKHPRSAARAPRLHRRRRRHRAPPSPSRWAS